MPWLLLFTKAKTFLSLVPSKTIMIVVGAVAGFFLVLKPLRRWITDVFSDNRTTEEKAEQEAKEAAEDMGLDYEEVAQGAKDLGWWLGELPDMSWGERNDVNHRDIYEYLMDIDKTLFNAIKPVYRKITRGNTTLLDDLRKHFNKTFYRRLEEQNHLGL